jgi:tetratricopeptide (TPR) repeat protein
MKRASALLTIAFLSLTAFAQLDHIVIPAGTPEDQALQAISSESDAQKKPAMYEEFLQKFASNPAAVAYGNWQLSQLYQNSGDLQKALEYGDKALASSPHNVDILVSQTNIAQQLKNNEKVMEYAVRGGETYNSIEKQPKPGELSDQDFASRVEQDKASAKSSHDFLEIAAYNAIAGENNAKLRMGYIEQFTPAFPNSQFANQVSSFAMASLSELNDMPRLVAYGEKSLKADPNSLSALLLMAGAYVDDPKPGSLTKAITYSQRAIEVAKADAPDADHARKLSAGVAYSTLGYAYMKQDKTPAAVPELKTAVGLLKTQDDQQYAIALYRLGFAYAKQNKVADAREVLTEAVKISGPVQPLAQDLLVKVNSARAKTK